MAKYMNLGISLFPISFPLIRSFESRVRFVSKGYSFFQALLITATFFMIWDHWFAVIGIFIFQLPIEELLFLFILPFACIFIYDVLLYFFTRNIFMLGVKFFVFAMIPILFFLSFLDLEKMYTAVNLFLSVLAMGVYCFIFKERFMGKFIFAYMVDLFPFITCNGYLTGGINLKPVLIYTNDENLGIRI